MAYVLRLIAGAALSLFGAVALADVGISYPSTRSFAFDMGDSICSAGYIYVFDEFIPVNSDEPSFEDENMNIGTYIYKRTSESCGVCNTYETLMLGYDPGKDSICSSGCRLNFHEYYNGSYIYQGIGEACNIWDGNPFPPDPNGVSLKECPAYDLKSFNRFHDDKICTGGCAYDFVSKDSANSEYFVYEGKGEACGPGTNNDEYSHNVGNYETEETKLFKGMPAGFTVCGDNLNYLHDCYKYDEENEEWRYWYRDDGTGVCDDKEGKKEWDDCYFNGKYYRRLNIYRFESLFEWVEYPNGFGAWKYGWVLKRVENEWDSYFDFQKRECEEDYYDTKWLSGESVGTDVVGQEKKWYWLNFDEVEYAAAKQYCANRFRSNEEDNLYEHAVSDTINDTNVSENLTGNTTIDIKNLFGISEADDNSLSSAMPDFLQNSFVTKSGEFGTCLDDLELMVFGYEFTLPFSRVCPWLQHLGTIFVFLAFFSAVHIIVKG